MSGAFFRVVYTAHNPATGRTVNVEYDTDRHRYVIRTTLNAADWPVWDKDERDDAIAHSEHLAAQTHQREGDSQFGGL